MAQNGWLRDIGDEILPSYMKIISEANYFDIILGSPLNND